MRNNALCVEIENMIVKDLWLDAPTEISNREIAIESTLIKKTCIEGVWAYEIKIYTPPERKDYAKGKWGQADYNDDCVRLARLAGEFLTYTDKTTNIRIRVKT